MRSHKCGPFNTYSLHLKTFIYFIVWDFIVFPSVDCKFHVYYKKDLPNGMTFSYRADPRQVQQEFYWNGKKLLVLYVE